MRLLVLTLVLLTSVSFNSAHAQENISAYKIVEPGKIVNDNVFSKDFNQIMIHARNIMQRLMGTSVECAGQVIDDNNNIPKTLILKQRRKK